MVAPVRRLEVVMKKLIARTLILLALAMLVLPLAGCSLFGIDFINNSSYSVHVTPVEQDWEFFILDPGGTHHVSEAYVNFLYWPTTVACDDSQDGKIVFKNR